MSAPRPLTDSEVLRVVALLRSTTPQASTEVEAEQNAEVAA